MNTPNSFYIVLSIATSILALSIYQLFGIVNIGNNVLFCFSVSALLFSINSFLDNFCLKSDKLNKIYDTIKMGLQIIAVTLMIGGPYIIKVQAFDNLNNSISLLSLALIILSIGISDIKKYDAQKQISDMYKSGFLKQFNKGFRERHPEIAKNSSKDDSSEVE